MTLLFNAAIAFLLSQAGLNRLHPLAPWILPLAVLLPSLDSLLLRQFPVLHYKVSHAALHSLVTVPLVGVVSAAAVCLIRRARQSFGKAALTGILGASLAALFAAEGHPGARLLWPFSHRWFGGGFLPPWDLWVLVFSQAALFFPAVLNLAGQEIGSKTQRPAAAARVALAFFLGVMAARFFLHQRALATLDSRVYPGGVPIRVAATAVPWSPFRWNGLVETETCFILFPQFALSLFDPQSGIVYPKPERRPEIDLVAQLEEFRVFATFYQWVWWRATPAARPEGAWEIALVALDATSPAGVFPEVRALVTAERRVSEIRLRP